MCVCRSTSEATDEASGNLVHLVGVVFCDGDDGVFGRHGVAQQGSRCDHGEGRGQEGRPRPARRLHAVGLRGPRQVMQRPRPLRHRPHLQEGGRRPQVRPQLAAGLRRRPGLHHRHLRRTGGLHQHAQDRLVRAGGEGHGQQDLRAGPPRLGGQDLGHRHPGHRDL